MFPVAPPTLCDGRMFLASVLASPWVEETIEQTLTFFLPFQHHKHLKSTNMLERLNEEIRRRTYLVLHLSQYRELPRS